MKRWYVVHTHTGAEALAEANLVRQGFHTYLPRCAKTVRHARRTATVAAPLFPRYLFVEIDLSAQRWRAIQSSYGVKSLVAFGDKPAPVPEGVVEELRAREGDDGTIGINEPTPFQPGEVGEITGGAMDKQTGWFQALDARQRVTVLLELLGRSVPVRVPLASVRAYA